MKKKIFTIFLSLINCFCLVVICTSLTGCGAESLSEAESQLFQITCKSMTENANASNSTETIKYASMVCNYDEDKNGTKVLATEIRSNGYNTPYEDGNYLGYNVTFITTLESDSNTKVTASAFATFNLASASTTKKIANYIFCSVDPRAKTSKYKTSCENDNVLYSKKALDVQSFVTLVRQGSVSGHTITLSSSEKIPSFTIYQSTTTSDYRNNGLKNLNIVKQIYDGSTHEAATTISAKQRQVCSVALNRMLTIIDGIDNDGNEISGYRNNAILYILSKMNGALPTKSNNPKFAGSLINSYFEENTSYDFNEDTGVTSAGCQASIDLTLNNAYQYTATYTFTASKTTEGTSELWTITDKDTGSSYILDDTLYIMAEE